MAKTEQEAEERRTYYIIIIIAFKILTGKRIGKRPLGRPRRR